MHQQTFPENPKVGVDTRAKSVILLKSANGRDIMKDYNVTYRTNDGREVTAMYVRGSRVNIPAMEFHYRPGVVYPIVRLVQVRVPSYDEVSMCGAYGCD